MFKTTALFSCVLFCGLTLRVTFAMTDEQKAKIHKHFEELGTKCFEEHAITEEDINQFRAKMVPTGPNVPCFLACMNKQIGTMNADGFFVKETALEMAKKIFEDEEELKNIEDFLHSCSHINDAVVSDGSKGCERSLLSYKCMLENASKFGFDL